MKWQVFPLLLSFFFLFSFSCSSWKTDPWTRCLHCYCYYYFLLLLDASAFESESESSGSEFCEEVCGRKGRIRAVWRRECRGKLRSSPERQTAVNESQAAATFELESLGRAKVGFGRGAVPFSSRFGRGNSDVLSLLACLHYDPDYSCEDVDYSAGATTVHVITLVITLSPPGARPLPPVPALLRRLFACLPASLAAPSRCCNGWPSFH